MVKEQLPLRFSWRDGISLDNYFAADNAGLVHALRLAATGDGEQFLYLWGGAATGKSHLLQAACQQAAEQHQSVAYLPLEELVTLSSEIFDGLEQLSLVCIDDLQVIAGKADWEEALFHLYNRMRDAGSTLLVAASVSPAALPLGLADLRSRLSWGPVFHIQELDDADKIAALQLRATGRGFDLPDEVAQFLIRRSPRDMSSLFALLDRLDLASLAQQRKLTIPFVRNLV
jgi:DnaA family protein